VRLITYQSESGPRVAGLRAEGYVDLNRADPAIPACIKQLLGQGSAGLERARAALAKGQPFGKQGVKVLAPVPHPQKVICIGLNYADHAKESGVAPPPEPVVFSKFPTTVAADGDPIVLPRVSKAVDYEAELVAVIGVGGRHISVEKALSHVAGYCPGHDVSARDWQLEKPSKQWLLGKSFDTFAPFGPELVTSDEVGDPGQLRIAFRLNGKTLQDSSTRQLIFSVAELIAYISQICTLLPGDVIFTGTPAGVGMARQPARFLQPGQVLESWIEGIGTIRNRCV
jgi:2-keto-4-pentenoate hydratase/2-oxohepta-3-ene-1,7-dioic acid hydratase in catechol pathway